MRFQASEKPNTLLQPSTYRIHLPLHTTCIRKIIYIQCFLCILGGSLRHPIHLLRAWGLKNRNCDFFFFFFFFTFLHFGGLWGTLYTQSAIGIEKKYKMGFLQFGSLYSSRFLPRYTPLRKANFLFIYLFSFSNACGDKGDHVHYGGNNIILFN